MSAAAHILGNLGKISQQFEIEHYIDEQGYLPSDIIGKTGIEHRFEANLKGQDGSQRVVVDSKGQARTGTRKRMNRSREIPYS
jgi:penicillin-binding protein 2